MSTTKTATVLGEMLELVQLGLTLAGRKYEQARAVEDLVRLFIAPALEDGAEALYAIVDVEPSDAVIDAAFARFREHGAILRGEASRIAAAAASADAPTDG